MRRAAVLLAAMVAVGASACGPPSVPAQPAYDVDVRPILMAHCVRCHGAGGMLNAPPGVDGAALQATHGYLDRYDDEGDCTADPSTCKVGAKSSAAAIPGLVRNAPLPILVMPPPPAPALDDWAVDILRNWAKNPVCSNAASPDSRVCPNGP